MWTIEIKYLQSSWNGTLPSQLGGGLREKTVSLGGDTASQDEMVELARTTLAELRSWDPTAKVRLKFRGNEVLINGGTE